MRPFSFGISTAIEHLIQPSLIRPKIKKNYDSYKRTHSLNYPFLPTQFLFICSKFQTSEESHVDLEKKENLSARILFEVSLSC